MSSRPSSRTDARTAPRLKLPAMYTLARVKPRGDERYRWTGYIYDISASGMRIELDDAVDLGAEVEVRAMLPGANHTSIHVSGHIVRMHDDADEPGPMRMGLTFDRFHHPNDRKRLNDYLRNQGFAQAA